MSKNEIELLSIINNSSDPQKVGEYALSLFLDYLHTHGSSQDNFSAVPQESA